jgi:hypothetical protein
VTATTAQGGVGFCGVAFLVVVFGIADTQAQQFVATGRDTLRGLPGVEVLVEPLAPELEQGGLTATAIRANVEGQLRAGAIRIYSSQTANPSLAKPYLYVQVSGLSLPQQGYALAIQVHLRQTLRSLVTGSAVVNAMSWDQQTVTVALPGSGMQGVHREVRSLVDRFIQDWRAVH